MIDALLETAELPLDPTRPLHLRDFSIARRGDHWMLEPRPPPPSNVFGAMADELNAVRVNREALKSVTQLRDGDAIDTALSRFLFLEGPVARNPVLEAAALSGGEPAWRVLSDWLQDSGDPLGEHLARHIGEESRRCLNLDELESFSERMIGDQLISGDGAQRLEVDEVHGVVRRITIRSCRQLDAELARTLARRQSRFAMELIVDAPLNEAATIVQALSALALPSSLRRISLGARTDRRTDFAAPATPRELLARFPELEPHVHVRWATNARLEVISAGSRSPSGLGDRPVLISRGMTLVATSGGIAVEEKEPVGAGRTYVFRFENSRWHLVASDFRDSLVGGGTNLRASISGIRVRNTPLLDGDVIDLGAGTLLRFTLT